MMFGPITRYFRKRPSRRYPERFIQGVDYVEIEHPEYKYEMIRSRGTQTRHLGYDIRHKYFHLQPTGMLFIFFGYRSDGPSGPTEDTPSFMRPAFGHDVSFQILREGLIPDEDREEFFDDANADLQAHAKEDGMMWPRYYLVYTAVDSMGAKHAKKETADA